MNIMTNNWWRRKKERMMKRNGLFSVIAMVVFLIFVLIQIIYLPMLTTRKTTTNTISNIQFNQYFIIATTQQKATTTSSTSSSTSTNIHQQSLSSSSVVVNSSLPLLDASSSPPPPPPPPPYLDDDVASQTTLDNDNDNDNDYDNELEEWWKVTTSSSQTLIDDIDLDTINITTKCGYWKCYYKSKSHPKFGYLIGQDRRRSNEITIEENNSLSNEIALSNVQSTYELALRLEKQYGIRHLMVSPPIPFINTTTIELVNILNMGYISYASTKNSTTTKSGKNTKLLWFRLYRPSKNYVQNIKKQIAYTHKKYKLRNDTLIIQVVKEAPTPNLLLKGYRLKNKIWTYRGATKFFLNTIPQVQIDNDKFRQNLSRDWNATKLSWLDTPQLLDDYQFLIDYQGRIWHIDFDRINGFIALQNNNNNNNLDDTNTSSSNVTTILSKLNHIEEYVINELIKFKTKQNKKRRK